MTTDIFQPDAALHPLLPADELRRYGIEPPHKRFTVSGTAYMRNQSREALWSNRWLAIHYQAPPKKTERGVSMGMRFPILILADYVEDQQATAEKVARILEQHWDEDHG